MAASMARGYFCQMSAAESTTLEPSPEVETAAAGGTHETQTNPRRPTPRELSHQLRKESDPHLQRRRWIVGLSALAGAGANVVGLYQMGILPRIPDFPSDLFDATRVDAGDYAYKRLQTPDALLMGASIAVTAILAGAGRRDRARTDPLLPIALTAKTVADAAVAIKLGREEWNEHRALCGYCQTATVISLVSIALALPEALEAIGNMRNRPGRAT